MDRLVAVGVRRRPRPRSTQVRKQNSVIFGEGACPYTPPLPTPSVGMDHSGSQGLGQHHQQGEQHRRPLPGRRVRGPSPKPRAAPATPAAGE